MASLLSSMVGISSFLPFSAFESASLSGCAPFKAIALRPRDPLPLPLPSHLGFLKAMW